MELRNCLLLSYARKVDTRTSEGNRNRILDALILPLPANKQGIARENKSPSMRL